MQANVDSLLAVLHHVHKWKQTNKKKNNKQMKKQTVVRMACPTFKYAVKPFLLG